MHWWRSRFELKVRMEPAGFLLAAIYAVACWAARQVSLDQFYLPAGIRVAALLLSPPRLWPYLLLGEYAYFAQMRYPLIETYGAAWAVLGSMFLMPMVAAVVRCHGNLVTPRSEAWLLSIAVVAALAVTALNLAFSHLLWPVPRRHDLVTDAIRYAVGDYVGILTVAPLALLWRKIQAGSPWKKEFSRATMLWMVAMCGLGLAAWLLPAQLGPFRVSLQLLMALPAIVLTCMHGWKGAAIAIPAINLHVGLAMPSPYPWSFDSSTFVTQQILAITGSALLAMGYSISHYYHQYREREARERMVVMHARSAHISSEMELRERVLDMRRVGDMVDHSLSEIAYWLKENDLEQFSRDLLRISVANSRHFREQTSMVYPTALEHVGLYLTLQISGINEAWAKTGRISSPRLMGDPCQLSVGLQLATYRTIADAVSLLLRNESGQIRVHARCGRFGRVRGIFASVELLDASQRLSHASMVAAIERLTGRTLAYNGTVQCRRNRVRIILLEERGCAADTPVESVRRV